MGRHVITVFHHEADRVIVDARRILRDLSAHGLLGDVVFVQVGDVVASARPPATRLRGGEDTDVALFDALAGDPAVDGHVMTAVASGDLAAEHQRELAGQLRRAAEQGRRIGGVSIVGSCLFVPESRDGVSLLPAADFFSEETANLVALPADWRFVGAVGVAIEFEDSDRAAWHAALEIATSTSAWSATADSRWQPEFRGPGVPGASFRFVRSAARLVTVGTSGPAAAGENVLPVPDGFTASPVPELVERTVALLHPEAFRLDSRLAEAGAVGRGGGMLRRLAAGLGGLFPPLAQGLRGFGRTLRTEVVKALGGDAPSGESDQLPALPPDRRVADAAAVVLEGFEPKVWTDLVRNVLGVADGGGAADARRAGGHERFVFVARESLVDDVLEQRIGLGFAEDNPVATGGDGLAEGDADVPGREPAPAEGAEDPREGAGRLADGDAGATGHEPGPAGSDEDRPEGGRHAEGDADPAGPTRGTRGLLTLVDDAFRREIARAEDRRSDQQRELTQLAEQAERTEKFEPPAALRTTIVAFFVTAFIVVASYVLLLDAFDFGHLDSTLMTLLAIVATAITWLVLLYPLTPRGDDDPRAPQSHLLRSAAIVATLAALAAVFAEQISDFAAGRQWPELVPVAATVVTVRLAWIVLRSERAREQSAGRALALAWTLCYLVTGALLYANMDRSVFNRWGWLRQFVASYGPGIRYAAVAVAGFLFLLALVMLAVGDAGADRRRRRTRARMRELREELEREELLPMLRGLRVNWLGTAAALDHILRRAFPPAAADSNSGELRPPLLRMALRFREAYRPPPPPGWLFARYEMAVDAYSSRREASARGTGWVRPETATMVSRLDRNPLAAPGADPRWDFAYRLGAGEFDSALGAGSSAADDGSLLDADMEFMREIVPVAPATLPLGLVGPGAAALGRVNMEGTWWWPDGFAVPESLTPPRSCRPARSAAGHAYLAARLDVSDPVLERQLSEGPAPPVESDDEPPEADSDDGLR